MSELLSLGHVLAGALLERVARAALLLVPGAVLAWCARRLAARRARPGGELVRLEGEDEARDEPLARERLEAERGRGAA